MALPPLALPGQPLGPSTKYTPGPGTHIHASSLCASLLGPISTTPSSSSSSFHPTLSIQRPTSNVLPEVESVVLGRVVRLTPRQATVEILVVGDAVCREGFQGIIRVQDVRATEKDRVKVGEMFRVGDVVRGVVVSVFFLVNGGRERAVEGARAFIRGVFGWERSLLTIMGPAQISLGDQSNYYLSTASNELGVVMATSEDGNQMYPISWKEFRDPETGATESRKVAKPF